MRTIIFALFISILSFQCIQVNAQKDDDRHERIKAMKVAFITEKLELSTGEAEKFWPVYNDYDRRKNKVMQEIRNLRKYYIENQDNLDDKEHLELLDKFIKLQQQDAGLLPSYQEKFIEVLPPKKVMKLYIAEIQFKNYLLQKLREHDGQGRGKQEKPE
ncbi:MAG: hypothetical protein ISS19_06030 [Bacteroidales bacterium]|nr:hypothetical protein [Bacteroidales bacterium]